MQAGIPGHGCSRKPKLHKNGDKDKMKQKWNPKTMANKVGEKWPLDDKLQHEKVLDHAWRGPVMVVAKGSLSSVGGKDHRHSTTCLVTHLEW